MKDFIDQRWGDLVALFLILLGVTLVMIAAHYTAATDAERVTHVGESLIGMGAIVLRLKSQAPNGSPPPNPKGPINPTPTGGTP